MTTTLEKQCDCGLSFSFESKSGVPAFWDPTACPECMANEEAALLAEQQLKEAAAADERTRSREKLVNALTPARFRHTDIRDLRFNSGLWAKVSAWQPTSEKPWLGIIGEPGEGKTRCAYLRLHQLAGEEALLDLRKDYDFEVITGMEFARAVADQYSKAGPGPVRCGIGPSRGPEPGIAEQAAAKLRKARTCAILFFDELGKVKPTPGTMEELFALINHRHACNLPTLWTSNTSPEEFCPRWPEEFAGPGCGRILESSSLIRA